MFARPFRTKSNVAIKGSDRKRLRSDLGRLFGDALTSEEVLQIVPNKEEMTVMKLYSHKGENIAVYCVQKRPVLFEHEKVLYPTIYTAWKYPKMMTFFMTHTHVFEKLHNGADLMLPGVIAPPSGMPEVMRNQVVAINVTDNRAALAVGVTLMSSREMIEIAGMKGKGVKVMHTFGDHLWMIGDKQEPPKVPVQFDIPVESDSAEPIENEEAICDSVDLAQKEDGDVPVDFPNVSEICLAEDEDTEKEKDPTSDVEAMEQLLHQCFMTALKRKLKDTELPILTSTFYRTHVLTLCPGGRSLDIKKTSFKKLGKYLKHMENEGLVQTKEVTKGNDYIIAVCRMHPT